MVGCSLFWFSQHSCPPIYLRGHALKQEMCPTSPPILLPVSLCIHLALCSQASCYVSPAPLPFLSFPANPKPS